jgi:hypothetical protein
METVRFNIPCNERKKNSAFAAFFNRHFRILLLGYFSVRVVRTCQTCYRYYCLNLVTALQLSVPPSNELNNTKRHQHKNVVTLKRWRIWKKENVIYIFCSKWSPQPPYILYQSFESPCIREDTHLLICNISMVRTNFVFCSLTKSHEIQKMGVYYQRYHYLSICCHPVM